MSQFCSQHSPFLGSNPSALGRFASIASHTVTGGSLHLCSLSCVTKRRREEEDEDSEEVDSMVGRAFKRRCLEEDLNPFTPLMEGEAEFPETVTLQEVEGPYRPEELKEEEESEDSGYLTESEEETTAPQDGRKKKLLGRYYCVVKVHGKNDTCASGYASVKECTRHMNGYFNEQDNTSMKCTACSTFTGHRDDSFTAHKRRAKCNGTKDESNFQKAAWRDTKHRDELSQAEPLFRKF
ncbi:hypothetical protein C8Q75DRAFT_594566 [Abortiporus biennis]|nr:hypothetical protein C8Q75DRAFT_594566 [Abortiporus biennis]